MSASETQASDSSATACSADVLSKRVACAGVLDHDQYEDLLGLFGAEALAKLLAKFQSDLRRRLDIVDSRASRADIVINTHAMISSAGSLGFIHFSDLCRGIERAGLDGDDLEPGVAAFAAGGRNVLLAIETIAGSAEARSDSPGSTSDE